MVSDAKVRATIEAYLEPEGFDLSDDPAVQVQQILHSAAGTPFDPRPPMPLLWDGDQA